MWCFYPLAGSSSVARLKHKQTVEDADGQTVKIDNQKFNRKTDIKEERWQGYRYMW